MKKQGRHLSREEGFTLVYMAGALTTFLLFTGLALDGGRAYVVKAQLSKAVDGAALAAARNLNTGNPRAEAARIFNANFPSGWFGTTSVTSTSDPSFFSSTVFPATGVNVVSVQATAVLPTTFMRLANWNEVTVTSSGEAQRRMVDLSLVLDVSSSIGGSWGAVRDASRAFVNSFDAAQDRLALLFFGNGVSVVDQMPSSRGFDKSGMMSDIPTSLPGGSTNMVEGLYRGWDEVRSVPIGSRSGLRVIVLFTDGASNSVPANWDGSGLSKALRTYDFPHDPSETAGQTHDSPHITGIYNTNNATQGALTTSSSPSAPAPGPVDLWQPWDTQWTTVRPTTPGTGLPLYLQWMPATSLHSNRRSIGIPTTFPLQTNALTVNGIPQSTARGLRDLTAGKYPSQIYNINNAARNLVEIIANAAREETETGSARVRIYTIGMGQLVRLNLGTRLETSESILKRIANDPSSPDFNSNQLEGAYYYAQTAADVSAAFQALQNQIVRLSK
jgi:Flp pilus assembly protein TadG